MMKARTRSRARSRTRTFQTPSDTVVDDDHRALERSAARSHHVDCEKHWKLPIVDITNTKNSSAQQCGKVMCRNCCSQLRRRCAPPRTGASECPATPRGRSRRCSRALPDAHQDDGGIAQNGSCSHSRRKVHQPAACSAGQRVVDEVPDDRDRVQRGDDGQEVDRAVDPDARDRLLSRRAMLIEQASTGER